VLTDRKVCQFFILCISGIIYPMKPRILIVLSVLMLFILAGCKTTPSAITESPVVPSGTQEPVLPTATTAATATSLPMALRVNGEGILLTEYEAELSRLQSALTELKQEMTPEDQKTRVLDNFIDELLLAQAAVEAGHPVSDEDVQARIDGLVSDLGSVEKLTEWQNANYYTDESLRIALKRAVAAAWQRDAVTEAVPKTAEQIHARQLFFKNEANAIAALKQLESGIEFDTLANQQDPTLGGDLGWFPRGMLTQPEVEEVVFTLQIGQTSGIIASSLGFHIVNVLERDNEHPLSTEARLKMQREALASWLKQAREKSTIEILVP